MVPYGRRSHVRGNISSKQARRENRVRIIESLKEVPEEAPSFEQNTPQTLLWGFRVHADRCASRSLANGNLQAATTHLSAYRSLV